MIVRHTCDVPACVNPAHLILGTLRDNSQDMIRKNRQRGWFGAGEKHPMSKLTASDVVAILGYYAAGRFGYKQLSKMFGVSPTTIQHIISGDTWKHVA